MKQRPKWWYRKRQQRLVLLRCNTTQLLFLLLSQHRQRLLTECAFTARAFIKPLIIAIVQLAHREMQVTNAAARAIRLAGNLPVMLE